ncbi:MAG: spore germination protein GerW family protein [Clostridia bacterium]
MAENCCSESKNQVEAILRSTLENLKTLIDVNNVVGKPINIDRETIIIPISRVSLGFVGGGSEFNGKLQKPEQNSFGGSGAGVSIIPIGFLVCGEKTEFIKIDKEVEKDKWTNLIKSALDVVQKRQ